MKKVLLVGNGFTSQLIPEYKNEIMMQRIRKEIPDIFEKANQLFEPFLKKVNSVQYTAVGWGNCGDCFCGLPSLDRPISDRPYNNELLVHIEKQLEECGFCDVQSISNIFFQNCGLIYETQYDEISNVESLLKVIALFSLIGKFSEDDKNHLKSVSNRIYYNNGKCGRSAVSELTSERIQKWLVSYKMIFTTNYDILMDEILQTDEIKHLHGGFFYDKRDRIKRSNSLISPENACLIWGISGEEKKEEMKKGGGFRFPIHFPLVSPISIFSTYLSHLKCVDAERIDIFGYSGENDQHINAAISQNQKIKQVHYFCNPKDVTSSIEKFEVSSRFSIKDPQKLILESWNTVWDLIHQHEQKI